MRTDAPTPLLEIDGIFIKLECVHASGSIKDRIVRHILTRSIETGQLRKGMRIVEATSGNTGVALAFHGVQMGFDVTIVMPEHMTEERKELIRRLGAELVLVSKEGSFAEAVEVRDRIAQDPDVFNLDQFANPLNVECHRVTTGAEILDSIKGKKIDAFVAGVGTGGTLIGVGEAIRQANPKAWIAAVEPAEAAVMTGGPNGPHEIFGIGDGFIPPLAEGDRHGLHAMIDEVLVVSSKAAKAASHDLRETHGLCVGLSSGANYLAAQTLQERFKTVVTVFADGFAKYASHGLRKCEGRRCPFEDRCPEPIAPQSSRK